MPSFEPLINLLVLLTILSVVAERVANVIKFRTPTLRDREVDREKEREREGSIQSRAILIGVAVAVLAKADLFSILTHLDDPWSTLGWVRVTGAQWYQSPALQSTGAVLYALAGSALTGLALGFGSKFWHDVLSTVYELRTIARQRGTDAVTVLSEGPAGDSTIEEGDDHG
jgi:hypothetical protein